MEGMDVFRPIQCYSCFSWCKHFRPNCPKKHEAQICSRCSETGHDYLYCMNAPQCLNCQGPHPATARVCPEYAKAVESQLPIIAKQLAHLNSNNTITHPDTTNHEEIPTYTDNVIGTDILRSATLEATNKDEFLESLYQICNQTILSKHSNETINSDYCDLNNTNSTLADTAHHITDISQILLPNNTHSNRTPALHTNFIHKYEQQYTLTNNGIELLDVQNNNNLRTCNLIEPHTDAMIPNLIFLKTTSDPSQLITFFNEYTEISIETEMINLILIGTKSIKLLTVQGIYEIILLHDHKPNSMTIARLAHWLKSKYSIPIDYST